MGSLEDFEKMWEDADASSHEKEMSRRRAVARLVVRSVGHRDEIDDVVAWLHDETLEIDRETLDEITIRANLNQRSPMENANPSKTEINEHLRQICNLAKRNRK